MNSHQQHATSFQAKQLLNQQISGLRDVFVSIISDETVTEGGLSRLNHFYQNNPIPLQFLPIVRDEAFCQAAHFEILDQGTANQETFRLIHLAIGLGISPHLLTWMEEEVCTLALLEHIQDCPFDDIPTIKTESIILNPGERAFAELPTMLVEEHTIDQDLDNGLSGKSFRLMRGVKYKIGDKKNDLLDRTDISDTDSGYLILTDKRIVYSGSNESFSVEINSLFGTRMFADSIQFTTIQNEKLVTIGFQNPLAAEYCGVVLSKLLNR